MLTRAGQPMTEDRCFREHFGCGAQTALALWALIVSSAMLPEGGSLHHTLWTLLFMKVRAKSEVMSRSCGGADKTAIRKWVWLFVPAIASLESLVASVTRRERELTLLVSRFLASVGILSKQCLLLLVLGEQITFENRLKGDKGNDCLLSVDGTDCRIPEHGRRFCSHKFKKSGLRCEVGLCVITGDCVWINGPHECGTWNDLMMFRNSIMSHLGENERVEADDGCLGEAPRFVKCPKSIANCIDCDRMQQHVRNRQETINKRFKNWWTLKDVFRHEITDHGDVFRCVAIITQLQINGGERLFDVQCEDPWLGDNRNAAMAGIDPDL
jgi:hypothetical protein